MTRDALILHESMTHDDLDHDVLDDHHDNDMVIKNMMKTMTFEHLAVPVAGILAVSQLARLHIQGVSGNL